MRTELVQATEMLRSGRLESVDEAIRLLQNTVYSFSMKVCGHPEDAQDTMQEVLMRSLPHLAKIDDPRALAVWLYKVARNHCWRMRRKEEHAPKQTLSLDDLMPDESELGLLLRDPAADPEDRALEGEQNRLLHRAILSIPPQYRIVLVLHDMEDLDTEETARVLGIRPGTVRVRLHRARLSVRKAMGRLLEGVSPAVEERGSHRAGRGRRREQASAKRRPLECRELFANLSEYMDGRVETRTCEEMRRHIEGCPACIAFIRDLRLAVDRCRKLETACDPELALRLRALITQEYLRLLGSTSKKTSPAL